MPIKSTCHFLSSRIRQFGSFLIDSWNEGSLDPEANKVLNIEALGVDDSVKKSDQADQDGVKVALPLWIITLFK